MWIAGVWNPLSEFPNLLEVLQKKVRQNVIWGYEKASPLAVLFRYTPHEESGTDGAAFFYPRRLCGRPQGRPGVTPGPPPVGLQPPNLHLISAPLRCQMTDKQCNRLGEVHFPVHLSIATRLTFKALPLQRCTSWCTSQQLLACLSKL